jgi:hypothetical protein
MGSHIIIINSIKAAHDLLDKRSAIYSDRYGRAPWGNDRTTRLYDVLIRHTLQTSHGRFAETVCLIGLFIAGIQVLTHPPRLNMEFLIGLLPYGPTWRHLRREFHNNFLPREMEPFERPAVHRLLRNFLSSPNHFSMHLRQ